MGDQTTVAATAAPGAVGASGGGRGAPTGASVAATRFFADAEGAPGDPRIDAALEELEFQCNSVLLLGSYAQARKRG